MINLFQPSNIPGVAKTHGKQDHACLFELRSRLHRVALRLPVWQEDGDLGRRGGVTAAWETFPQHVLQSQACLGAASPGSFYFMLLLKQNWNRAIKGYVLYRRSQQSQYCTACYCQRKRRINFGWIPLWVLGPKTHMKLSDCWLIFITSGLEKPI